MELHDLVINNQTVCTTPDATLVASFTVSKDLRTTERMMVTTSVLMTVLGAALFVLGVLGRFSGRHKGHSAPTRIFFRASFALFLPFMSYMFSQAKSKDVPARAQLILLWMLLVELLRKKVYAMVAPEGDAFARGVGRYSFFHTVEQAARMVWIGYLIYAYVHDPVVGSFFVVLWVFSVAKLCKRFFCIELAKRSLDVGRNARLISGYMWQLVEAKRQHEAGSASASPAHVMRTCNYAVMGEGGMSLKETRRGYQLKDDLDKILSWSPTRDRHPAGRSSNINDNNKQMRLVRVCTVWELAERDSLFRHNELRRRKLEDMCLGLALFKLLRRRFEGCPTPEDGTEQARDLVFRGLLRLDGASETEDAERAFEVVELEMNFLMEYYQAVIPVALPKPALFIANFAFSMAFILVYCIVVLLVTGNGNIFHVLASLFRGLIGLSIDMVVQYRCFRHQVSFLVDMVFSSSDLVVTFLLTLTLFAVEMYDFLQYLLSDWFMASVLCNYARNPSLQEQRHVRRVIQGALWMKIRTRPRIRVHQVEMLKLHPRKIWMLLSRLLKRRIVGLPRAVVTTEAKLAIVRCLKASGEDHHFVFGYGEQSLHSSGYGHLAWACSPANCESATELILVWHLATSLFETRERPELPPEGRAAVTLSKYCAYLVAYLPGLLPDDAEYADCKYRAMKREMFTLFRKGGNGRCRRERLLLLHLHSEETAMTKGSRLGKQPEELHSEETTMTKGSRLGKQLEERVTTVEDDESVWRALLGFWAELLVSIARAPSAGAEAHTLALAHGGEFITDVWAMLTHAGVHNHNVPVRHEEEWNRRLAGAAAAAAAGGGAV